MQQSERDQQPVVEWLKTPDAHGGETPEHLETQISHVFLVGDHALKLKKAVSLPFLDYSTPGRRKAATETEMALNRRTAPALYQGLVPVTAESGSFAIGGEAKEAVDWLVVMKRFGQGDLLDVMARDGRFKRHHAEGLADALADLHARAERRPDQGGAKGLEDSIAVVLDTLRSEPDQPPFPASEVEALADRLEAERARLAPKLEARRRHGRVVHGHGDLHLGNACLYDGQVLAFDAIEFSDLIACVDVLYDAAFALMDLLAHDLRAEAGLFLSRYLEATRDYSGLACLPLFVAVRALVRAMSKAFSSGGDANWAQRYFALAQQAIGERPEPRLLAVGGFSGTGKSTLAQRLALDLAPGAGAVHLRSDGIRKRLFGRAPEDRLPKSAYEGRWHKITYRRLYRDARRALLAGWPVAADATFTEAGSRRAIARIAERVERPFEGLWLEAAEETLKRRVAGRGPDASDADLAVLTRQLQAKTGPIRWRCVSAEDDAETVYRRATQRLALSS